MTISSGGFQRGKDSSMPAYKETLEEEEIWKIVDFLRSLEQDG
jgi:mono/diheme cytochrome c family protein|tara:strand:- start:3908 stop:4036 length:129 start_codon:yes stop_codon:yes gene_type:complete